MVVVLGDYLIIYCVSLIWLVLIHLLWKPATSDYIVRDTGNCSPRYMRCTINQVCHPIDFAILLLSTFWCTHTVLAWCFPTSIAFVFVWLITNFEGIELLFCFDRSLVLLTFWIHLQCRWLCWCSPWPSLILLRSRSRYSDWLFPLQYSLLLLIVERQVLSSAGQDYMFCIFQLPAINNKLLTIIRISNLCTKMLFFNSGLFVSWKRWTFLCTNKCFTFLIAEVRGGAANRFKTLYNLIHEQIPQIAEPQNLGKQRICAHFNNFWYQCKMNRKYLKCFKKQ